MKKGQKSIMKIVAGIVAILLIGAIFFITNAFVGNPLSAMMANKSIEKYVDRNYSYLDLEIEKATYNFKDGGYMARANSKTSIDTQFAIYYRGRRVIRDDYENYVLEKFNTIQRLSEEYSAITKKIISQELGYQDNRTMVTYHKDVYENSKDILELDMKFDKSLPLEAEVTIRLDLKVGSLEEAEKILKDAHKAFIENNYSFVKYSLFAESEIGSYMSVHGVTPEDIEGGNLLSLMEKAQEREMKEREAQEREPQEKEKKEIIDTEEYKEEEVVDRISVFIKE